MNLGGRRSRPLRGLPQTKVRIRKSRQTERDAQLAGSLDQGGVKPKRAQAGTGCRHHCRTSDVAFDRGPTSSTTIGAASSSL